MLQHFIAHSFQLTSQDLPCGNSLGFFEVSPSGEWLAYGYDDSGTFDLREMIYFSGNERFQLCVMKIGHSGFQVEKICDVGSMMPWQTVRWSKDSTYFLYTQLDSSSLARKCYRYEFI